MTHENALLSQLLFIFSCKPIVRYIFLKYLLQFKTFPLFTFFNEVRKKRWASNTLVEIFILYIQHTGNISNDFAKNYLRKAFLFLLIFTKSKSKLIFKIILNYHFKIRSFYAYKQNFVPIHHKRACDFLSLNNITNKILGL